LASFRFGHRRQYGRRRWRSLTAVGDTVNTASRLEALCKVYDCELVVSALLLTSAGVELQEGRRQEVKIRSRSAPLIIHALRSARQLPSDSYEIRREKDWRRLTFGLRTRDDHARESLIAQI
jgi:hypothetical protein